MQITEARIMKRKCTFILMALCALAVGVVGALSGCEQDTSRKHAPAARPRPANHQQTPTGAANGASVRAFKLPMLIVHKVNEEDEGGCRFFPLTITLTKSGEPLRVSFSEDTPSGTGNVIRNSLWTAALLAALQKNSTLQGGRISLDFKGGIDGPSAGAVMCLGIMSALDQRGFPDDFAMTGALLPDGTIGLVGGVPEKLAAAAKDPKIKRVAIPAFQRFAQDKDGKWVDLFETGRKMGLELHPVESIADAYRILHREKVVRSPFVSAIVDCREDPAFESHAASIFLKRLSEHKARIDGLSSNLLEEVTNSQEWRDSINPQIAQSRFEEGAIFDALNLISVAAASFYAYSESWGIYSDYADEFMKTNYTGKGALKKSLNDTPVDKWPLDKRVAFTDGLNGKIKAFCEKALGYDEEEGKQNAQDSDAKSKPWDGFHPLGARSDFEAQFQSILESEKAAARYRHMQSHLPGRDELKASFESDPQTFFTENTASREDLYCFMSELYKEDCFKDVPMPILNAGPEVGAAMELFLNAWMTVDTTVDVEVMDRHAEYSAVDRDSVRNHFIQKNLGYSNYEFSKQRARDCFKFLSTVPDVNRDLKYPSWTFSCFLFNTVELFAEASAQLFALDGKVDNASFVAFVMSRARSSALRSIFECHNAGLPCIGPVLFFQKAERTRDMGTRTTAAILADYWKATMVAKALVMAFHNGIGPQQGFYGYPPPASTNAPSAK